MIVKRIELKDYRNYEYANLELNKGLNVLVGNNAQGKTNLLEAIFLCAIGKSMRTTKDKDLIRWGQPLGKIGLTLEKKAGKKTIDIYLQNSDNKSIKINQISIQRIGELMGEFNAVYFCPDDLKLIKESPDERRRFMDIDLSQFDKNYFYALTKYNKILTQRNKLLKSNSSDIKDTISIWNEQLSKVGAFIIKKRIDFISKLKSYADQAQSDLTGGKENMTLEYVGIFCETEQEIMTKLISSYESSFEKDLYLGYTTIGPHKDDIKIVVNGIDIRHFGSQGQQRTATLALKLSELEIFKESTGEYPILLLDDVLSELDIDRKEALLRRVSNVQTILTCTDFGYDTTATLFTIQNGTVLKQISL